MIDQILTALGITMVPTGAGIKYILGLKDRVQKVEQKQESQHEIVAVKLDAIAEKIDLRCDALEHRIDRIERKVLNGSYYSDDHR